MNKPTITKESVTFLLDAVPEGRAFSLREQLRKHENEDGDNWAADMLKHLEALERNL